MPQNLDKRHTFVIAGYGFVNAKPRATIWTVANRLAEDGRTLETDNLMFNIRKHLVGTSRTLLYVSGLCDVVSRYDKRRLVAKLKARADPDQVERALVDAIRAAASEPKWANGINNNVFAILMNRKGLARATHY